MSGRAAQLDESSGTRHGRPHRDLHFMGGAGLRAGVAAYNQEVPSRYSSQMSRRFTFLTVGLTAVVAFLIGLVVAGSMTPSTALSGPSSPSPRTDPRRGPARPTGAGLMNFAEVAERLNPSVVNIDATSRAGSPRDRRSDRRRAPTEDEPLDGPRGAPFDAPDGRRPERPQRGAGSGVIIEPDGHILTNHHVIDAAERITVKLADGRSLRAIVVGADAASDLALIKVNAPEPLPAAPLGDSDLLRAGEWVCAIGNPLAYEHTVTVGVVSYLGRKLFDASLDNYIQTDAAINFGNSGGPLLNLHGEVVGINSAISWRASNIGFAVPINQAKAILPQLKMRGRVSRGYIGITLKEMDPDLQRSLRLGSSRGALVMEVAEGSPAARVGIRTYDLILSVDGEAIATNDDLIRKIAAREPGASASLRVLRDGQEHQVLVKLAERPGAPESRIGPERPSGHVLPSSAATLGLTVRALTRDDAKRYGVPPAIHGLFVDEVQPISAAADVEIGKGYVIIEVNRRAMAAVADFDQIVAQSRPGDVLALYLYVPESDQRVIRTVRIEAP